MKFREISRGPADRPGGGDEKENVNLPERSPESVPENTEERVLSPAVRYKGEVFASGNHTLARDALKTAHPDFEKGEIEHGYVTSSMPFVDIEEGERIMKKSGQTRAGVSGY